MAASAHGRQLQTAAGRMALCPMRRLLAKMPK
jgi:hypothetical protein